MGGQATGGQATGGQPTGGKATGGTATGGRASGGSSTGGSQSCTDTCPFANGITWQCKKRFFYGVNLAWQNFASDFGSSRYGATATASTISSKFQTYASNGASVVRWWVWPNFSGGGVTFSGSTPTGLGGTTLNDLETALKLADQYNLYLQLTLFSFDNFKTTASPNLATIANNASSRAALVTSVVRPFARAAAQSAYAKRLISWDVINEPEWAITGSSLYGGDPAFTPNTGITTLTHAQMETLLKDVVAGLRAESGALITIGNAAMKWRHAWQNVDQDFWTYHIYDWVQQYWPYNQSPSSYGVGSKPVVMGEFPPAGLNSGAISYRTLLDSWYSNGYAGALPWQDGNMVINWTTFKAFTDAHPCETKY
jgi:hypothetical protein